MGPWVNLNSFPFQGRAPGEAVHGAALLELEAEGRDLTVPLGADPDPHVLAGRPPSPTPSFTDGMVGGGGGGGLLGNLGLTAYENVRTGP